MAKALPEDVVKSFLKSQAKKRDQAAAPSDPPHGGRRSRWGGLLRCILRGALGLVKLTVVIGSGAALLLLAKAHAERLMDEQVRTWPLPQSHYHLKCILYSALELKCKKQELHRKDDHRLVAFERFLLALILNLWIS